ncbi:polymer-forming cytoskeletal protein [Deferribacter autotrophicus]|uniref:Polymer-forming cytoskeletal protein n=1 Tax=Deferribacter autotrophicus TaxID=500465 RepID=A0A5A8F6X2_9BACT|nr:polymer-forming cytoskeletal protein [Deferribacter autotrophicus]KAA0257755.1 polymer-forming cytoskeletal protein [Deferribacter autotrophicus]
MIKGGKQESNTINAFLGKNTKFEGTLIFDGLVRIDGEFEGEVKSSDTFVVAETGKVKANVEAGVVKISGFFDGNIIAKNKVELYKPAIVKGTIKTPSLIIEDGVTFNGSCEMGKDINNIEKKLEESKK